jgi:hypothetical protein
MLVKVYFFGKGPGQGQIPGLLGHGPQIPNILVIFVIRAHFLKNGLY